MRKRKIPVIIVILFGVLCITEIILRTMFGFCDAPLSKKNDMYEYIFQPNQNRYRFRNRIKYNSQSMRSDEINPKSIKILGIGDSVINGGAFCDQDSIATSLLSSKLSVELDTIVQVLNISAGSWGPDNCNAYLEERGLFGAKAMLLVVSSHDAYDNMDFMPVVGINPAFPDKQYRLAWVELLDRYLIPKMKIVFLKKQPETSSGKTEGIKKNGTVFNTGFSTLHEKALKANIPMIIYLHAEKSEMNMGGYNEMGKQIIEFANNNNIILIKQLDYHPNDLWYQDDIHLNSLGQRKMAEIIKPYLMKSIK